MEDQLDERTESPPPDPPAGEPRDYADLGEHVAAVLRAAEDAAAEIRAEAERRAEAVRRRAETDARARMEDERARATSEARRLRAAAIADAEAIRDAAEAAAGRVAQEGQRRLGELRDEARALEGRFESTLDDLHELIAQLEAVVRNAVERPDLGAEPPGGQEDTDPGRVLTDDLWPAGGAPAPAPGRSEAPGSQPL